MDPRAAEVSPHARETPAPDRWAWERSLWARGARHVAGVDEAGRGPLAGPVVAAAVILPPNVDATGHDAPKKLPPPARERAGAPLRCEAGPIGVGLVEAGEIDRLNNQR